MTKHEGIPLQPPQVPEALLVEHGGVVDLTDGQPTPGSVVVEGSNQIAAALPVVDRLSGGRPTVGRDGGTTTITWQGQDGSTTAASQNGVKQSLVSRIPPSS